MSFSKKEVVLTIANKEGGAHVDKLPEKYELVLNAPLVFQVNDKEIDSLPLGRLLEGQSGAELLDCSQKNFAMS